MSKIIVSFPIEQDIHETMKRIADSKTPKGERSNYSRVYREAVNEYLENFARSQKIFNPQV